MAEFKDISQFTKVTPSGTEEIQISATQKAALSDIAKLSKPDDVPTTEQMNSAIDAALEEFKSDNNITGLRSDVENLKSNVNLMQDKFVTQAGASFTINGNQIVHATSASAITVTIADASFTVNNSSALVIVDNNVAVTFNTTGSGQIFQTEAVEGSDTVCYAIQKISADGDYMINCAPYPVVK